ncbi:MAG: phenylacetate--CoA ligase [Clostridia bacterium]
MIWNKVEQISHEELREIQSKNLRDTVKRVYENVPYYAKKMDDIGLKPSDIKSVYDLHKLPFTYKSDLRDNYPFDTFAVPLEDVVRVHASSGTTGKQTVVGYTKDDINMWSECVARALTAAGVTKKDIMHIAYGYGLFTGGLGLHYGAEKVGATVVPASSGNTSRQINLIKDFKATVLACTPSYALYLADEMKDQGIKKEDLNLRIGIFGAEPWTQEMRNDIENKLGIKAYDIYGLSEIAGPGVSISCENNCGMHIAADNFIPEIINPRNGEVLGEGMEGELVISCVTKQALPLLRYRTKDLSKIYYKKCLCGRTTPRMEKIKGRADDMLIIRGVNVFPSQIESVLLKFAKVEPHYIIYVDRINNLDVMKIEVEMSEDLFSDEIKNIEKLEKKLNTEMHNLLGISAIIKLVEPKSVARSTGKSKRVIDNRKLY